MRRERETLLASAITFGTGAMWGFYWLPVRALDGSGLPGAWGTVAITTAALLLLLPVALSRWKVLAGADKLALASFALGGGAFTLYSVGFVHGQVAIIILLWFLTPVWSTLIGRYLIGWRTPPLRLVAIALGLVGLFTLLGTDGAPPLPRGIGEWMALVAGMIWSVATTGMRLRPAPAPVDAAFVFATGAAVAALALALALDPLPAWPRAGDAARIAALAVATGGFWWVLSIAGLMWATVRLEPARVGILLMTEILVGAVSAALIAGESLTPRELIGGGLVLAASLLEVWPTRRLQNRL